MVLGDVPPYPPLDLQELHPAVNLWFKDDFNHAEATRLTGETQGDAPTDNPVQTPGGNHSLHYYLQHHDGSPVTKREVAALSFDARGLWTTLKEENQAPKTFSKMSSSAWKFFSQTLLANPDHAFLHWCDDGQWKLRKWVKQNYSSWTLNMRLRQKKAKKKPDMQNTETKKDDILDDPDLLRMTDQDNNKDNKGKGSSQSVSSNGDHGPSDSDQEGREATPPAEMPPVRQSPLEHMVPKPLLAFTPMSLLDFALQGSIVRCPLFVKGFTPLGLT